MIGVVVATVVFGGVVAWAMYRMFGKRKDNPAAYTFRTVAPEDRPKAATKESGNFVSKMKASNKSMIVFYGSQSGTAEGFAYRLAKDARRYGIGAIVMDPEGCQFEDLQELRDITNPLVVFCVATYGEGSFIANKSFLAN